MPYRASLEKLSRDLMIMAEMCERSIDTAIMALIDRNEEMATSVIGYDREIDEMELSVERDCLAILAESKLDDAGRRFVTSGMKINMQLERMGDHAVEIANHVLFLVRERSILGQVVDFGELVEQIEQILRESIESLLERDVDLARKIIDEHAVVSEEMAQIFAEVVSVIQQNPKLAERALHILMVAESLSRIADLAMNLAENVISMVEGESVDHSIRNIQPIRAMLSSDDADDFGGDEADEMEAVRVARKTRTMRKPPR